MASIFIACSDKDPINHPDEPPGHSLENTIEKVDAYKAPVDQIALLPKDFENDPNINEKMKNLSEEKRKAYTENYRVFDYLISIKKAEEISQTLTYGQLYTDVDMSEFLNEEQLNQMKNHNANLLFPRHSRIGAYWCQISCWESGNFKLYRLCFFPSLLDKMTQYWWYSQYRC